MKAFVIVNFFFIFFLLNFYNASTNPPPSSSSTSFKDIEKRFKLSDDTIILMFYNSKEMTFGYRLNNKDAKLNRSFNNVNKAQNIKWSDINKKIDLDFKTFKMPETAKGIIRESMEKLLNDTKILTKP